MQIGLMIEGQNGLNWEKWDAILQRAERGGFQCVFRSDHFTNPSPPDLDSLELWTSLTYAASHTRQIEFGPLVTPVTFRHPAMTARYAAAVDDLSKGRLVLGMGAGWQDREHRMFGIPFYDFKTRFSMLTEALTLTRQLLSGERVSLQGDYFTLEDAALLPKPGRKPPILIGGNGPKRTLPLAAKYADEWNGVYCNLTLFRERMAQLDTLCESEGRAPGDVKRSLMAGTRWVEKKSDIKALLAAASKHLNKDAGIEDLNARGLFAGTSAMMVDQLGAFAEAGCERVMLQLLDYDNLDVIDQWAADILPHFKP